MKKATFLKSLKQLYLLFLVLFSSMSYLAAQSYAEGADFPALFPVPSAFVFNGGVGTFNYSGRISTPSDGADYFQFNVPPGGSITSVKFTAGPDAISGFTTMVTAIIGNEFSTITTRRSGVTNGTVTPPPGSGAFNVGIFSNFSVGNSWTMTIEVALACPNLTAAAPAAQIITESACTGNSLSGGVLAAPLGNCPTGSSLVYATDGTNFSSTLPTYNQTMPVTVTTRCDCGTVSSPTNSVTTMPGATANSVSSITYDQNPISVNNNTGTTVNANMTVPTGTKRLLLVTIGTDDMTNTPTVLFDNNAMTLAAEDTDIVNTIYNSRVLVYYITLGDGSAITSSIDVSGLTNYYSVGGMSYQGIDQLSPLKQAAQAGAPTGAGASSQVAATINGFTQGNLLFSFFGEDNHQQFNWGGPYSSDCNYLDTGMDGAGYYYSTHTTEAAAGNQTFTAEINNASQSCAGVLLEFSVDGVVAPTVNLSLNPIAIDELNSNTLEYLFTLSQAVSSDLPIRFTISGTTEDDDDFIVDTPGNNNEMVNYTINSGPGNNNGVLTIKAGQTIGLLRITAKSDPFIENDETVVVTIDP